MGGVQSALGFGKTKPKVMHDTFFAYSAKKSNGEVLQFETLSDHAVLVVNVASK